MDLALSKEDLAIQARAREFTEKFLFPIEDENEKNNGGLSHETLKRCKQAILDYELNGMNHTVEDGGRGYTILQQTLISEEVGRSSGCVWDVVWAPAYPLRFATPEQKKEYLYPANLGDRREAYAITERDAGSDPRLVKTSATRRNGKFYLSGEKWFVTSGDHADFLLVHAHVDGDPDKPTLFIVDKDRPGVRIKRMPKFTHTFPFGHPEIVFEEVELDESKILGKVGDGFELTKDWFVEARIGIAARCVGGAIRATQVANDFAAERIQFGKPIRDHQAIEFMLADNAVEIMAAKALLYQVSWEAQKGDRRRVHGKASAAKLYCSEVANRVVDRCVQIMGGRGYMRENPVERLWRDLRVDRIWEGTSEIQRMIIGGQIKKRGLSLYSGWVDQ